MHFATSLREVCEKGSHEKACETHMTGSWRIVLGCCFRECLVGKAFPQDSHKTFCLEDFFLWIPYPSPLLYIPLLPTNVKEAIQREKHTPIFLRENYSSLVRNHCSLFSFPLPLSYIERRFLPKHYPHTFKVLRVFLVLLGSIGRCQEWRMQHGACCGIWRARQDVRTYMFHLLGSYVIIFCNWLIYWQNVLYL